MNFVKIAVAAVFGLALTACASQPEPIAPQPEPQPAYTPQPEPTPQGPAPGTSEHFEVTAGGTVLTVPAQERDTSALHTSCSQVFEVGMQLVDDDGTYTLTVESAENKAGEQLCEVSD